MPGEGLWYFELVPSSTKSKPKENRNGPWDSAKDERGQFDFDTLIAFVLIFVAVVDY